MTTGTKVVAVLLILANVVAAFVYEAWWMLAVAAGLVAVFAEQWRRGDPVDNSSKAESQL